MKTICPEIGGRLAELGLVREERTIKTICPEIGGRLAALGLLALAAPVLCLLSVWLLAFQGRPLFYAGKRIGRYGKLYKVYKFRTLHINAESLLGCKVCSDASVVTPIGFFLRVCRLDELPQLWNILNGTMNWFGPRPLREKVYFDNLKTIANYYKRLEVTPGLFGPIQAYCPHGAHKRFRFKFYTLSCLGQRPWTPHRKIGLIILTLYALAKKSCAQAKALVLTFMKLGTIRDRRSSVRESPMFQSQLVIDNSRQNLHIVVAAESTLVLEGDAILPSGKGTISMAVPKKGRILIRKAQCFFNYRKALKDGAHGNSLLLVDYAPVNDCSKYFIERYLLRKTIL